LYYGFSPDDLPADPSNQRLWGFSRKRLKGAKFNI